ncbi:MULTISPECIES: ParB/RepB/Spo0J family partition protein [unclassified Streptomyces]|uniref:ParB/RepB/Spo0J family partition protein n=1 Tax=unclassified Streptomyces TaxID=2593676 RepID=UPI0036E18D03
MSKADQLGAGRFGGAARPVSARRAAIGAATGVPTDGVAPPNRLPVTRISPNPENPRTSLGDLTELAESLKEHGQKQAITVMNRDAYLKANPARANDLEPDTTHVVVDGSSRLAAARAAGLTHLNVMIDDEQGADGDGILESALVANIHRSDLDPLDEAKALQRLLAIHGSQVKLAKRLSKSQGWVSQRLALLNLAPELQAVVGEEPVELLRSVAKEPHDRQEAALQELKAERARKEAERRVAVPAPAAEPGVPHQDPAAGEAVGSPVAGRGDAAAQSSSEEAPAATAQPSGSVSPVGDSTPGVAPPVDPPRKPTKKDAPVKAGETVVPDPRAADSVLADADVDVERAQVEAGTARRLPYEDGAFVAMHLIQKMSDDAFDKMLAILTEHQSQRIRSRT